jgi:hypothetical protein
MNNFDQLFSREKEYVIRNFVGELSINGDAHIWMNERAREGFILTDCKVITVTNQRSGNATTSLTIIMERDLHSEGNAFEGAAENIEQDIFNERS